MTSRIKRIGFKTTAPDSASAHDDPARHDRLDPVTVLTQIRSALAELQQTQAELARREQDLLAEASAHYEQLTATAGSLAGVRQQRDITAGHVDRLQSALRLLEERQIDAHDAGHREHATTDAVAVQSFH